MKLKFLQLLCGFKTNHNIQHSLIKMLEKWKLVLDKGPIGPIFMDLSDSFNTLDHKLLLENVYRRTNINDKSLGKKSIKVYRSVLCYALPTRQEDVVAMSQ